MFATEARQFIVKLIKIQRSMKSNDFVRRDYGAVSQSISELEKYLNTYKYETDEQMRGFWERKQHHIRNLIPGQNYSGFQNIMNEYLSLKNQ